MKERFKQIRVNKYLYYRIPGYLLLPVPVLLLVVALVAGCTPSKKQLEDRQAYRK